VTSSEDYGIDDLLEKRLARYIQPIKNVKRNFFYYFLFLSGLVQKFTFALAIIASQEKISLLILIKQCTIL
jgi:hypothetical protein